jgi:parallel beta-helix repeat protein
MINIVKVIFLLVIISSCQLNNKRLDYYFEKGEKEMTGRRLQELIDQLPQQGGEIKLPNGTFIINKPLELKNNVWLRGEGRGTILAVNDSIGIIMKGLKGAMVSDIAVKSVKRHLAIAGIVLDDCGDCQVNNVLTQGFKKYGIQMRNNSFLCELTSCKSADNGQANFYFENLKGGGRGGDYVPNIVTSCISYGGMHGFETKYSLVLHIIGCAVFQSLDYGFYIHDESNSVHISGCRTFQTGADGVFVDSSFEINLSSNTFSWSRGHGVVLDNVQWGTVSANNIIDSGVRTRDGSFRNGVVLKNGSQGIHITSNAIYNWGDQTPLNYGIIEDRSCKNNIIANNNINYFIYEGILSQGKGALVNNNIMVGDSSYVGMKRKPFPDFDTTRIHKFILDDFTSIY